MLSALALPFLFMLIGIALLVKGGDWKPKDIVGSDIVSSYNGEVKSLSFVDGKSTTDIINRLKEK